MIGQLLGRSVQELLPTIVAEWHLDGIGEIVELPFAGHVQGRISSAELRTAMEQARERRETSGFPFWHCVFSQVGVLSDESVDELMRLALFHRPMTMVSTSYAFDLNAEAVARVLDQHARQPTQNRIVALLSRLRLKNGRLAHIPMLDFRAPVTSRNERLIVAQLRAMDCPGWLFASGRSYHFFGRKLLDDLPGLQLFLGRSLLYAPLVDDRWIAHQLIEGACALRVSSGDHKQVSPNLVAVVE